MLRHYFMQRNSTRFPVPSFLLLSLLPACAAAPTRECVAPAAVEAALPASAPRTADSRRATVASPRQEANGPKTAQLTTGIGITDSPVSTLFGADYDVPVHPSITLGPSFQWGYAEDVEMFGAEAKGKFFLAPFNDTFQAFVSAGGGFGMVDKARVDEDWGLQFSVGAGLRVKTSNHGTLSSEVNLYVLPEDLVGEDTYYGWQIVQLSFVF